ncbi:hypothetical protein BH20CHL7_BH20CHL7_10440 [soil metagenome]
MANQPARPMLRKSVAVAGATLVVLAVVLIVGNLGPGRSADFWNIIRLDADEARGFASLEDLGSASDAVVLGRMSSSLTTREVQGDAAEDVVTYVQVPLDVTETFRGRAHRTVTLEFLLNVPRSRVPAAIDELRSALPRDEIIVFLHEKQGDGEAGLYRATAFAGLIARTARSPVDTPLLETPPDTESPIGAELSTWTSLERLADRLRGS